jgi:hypothetical protein
LGPAPHVVDHRAEVREEGEQPIPWARLMPTTTGSTVGDEFRKSDRSRSGNLTDLRGRKSSRKTRDLDGLA